MDVPGSNFEPREQPPIAEAFTLAAPELAPSLSVRRCLSDAWCIYTTHFWLLMAGSILTVAIVLGTAGILMSHLCGGWAALCLDTLLPGRQARLTTLVSQGRRFSALLIVTIFGVGIECLGLVACVAPGVLATGLLIVSFVLVVDRRLDGWEAMEVSIRVAMDRGIVRNLALGFIVILLNFVPISTAGYFVCKGHEDLNAFLSMVIACITWPLGWLIVTSAYLQQMPHRPMGLDDENVLTWDSGQRGFEVTIPATPAPMTAAPNAPTSSN